MSTDWNPGIVFAQLTDVGMRRANNQDSMTCIPATSAEQFNSRGHLLVVADGMGAHAAGELASQIATERIAMQYFRSSDGSRVDSLKEAVVEANHAIYQRGQSNPEFHNMGTTASALVIAPEGAIIGHVGDSRVYRLRDGVLEQLTFDHSLVWEMEAAGNSSQHFPKNVITRSLGPSPEVQVDIEGPMPVKQGDYYLVCSDGLTGLVEDSELGPLMQCLSEEKLVRVLVDLANLRGGPDNISVVVARVTSSPQELQTTSQPPHKPATVPSAMIFTTIACFVAAGILGLVAMHGPMFIAVVLGMIAGIITIVQWIKLNPAPVVSGPGNTSSGPYRRYDATPGPDLYLQLGETVAKLRQAAEVNNWLMDWSKVEHLQAKGVAALKTQQNSEAIRVQAEAVIETMNQLREQNNRSASDTAIE